MPHFQGEVANATSEPFELFIHWFGPWRTSYRCGAAHAGNSGGGAAQISGYRWLVTTGYSAQEVAHCMVSLCYEFLGPTQQTRKDRPILSKFVYPESSE